MDPRTTRVCENWPNRETLMKGTESLGLVEASRMAGGNQESPESDSFGQTLLQRIGYALATIFTVIASTITVLKVKPLELAIHIVVVIVLSVVFGSVIHFQWAKCRKLEDKLRAVKRQSEDQKLRSRELALKEKELKLKREKADMEEKRYIEDRRVAVQPRFDADLYIFSDEQGRKGRQVVITNTGEDAAKNISVELEWKKEKDADKVSHKVEYTRSAWEAGAQFTFVAGMLDEVGRENKFLTARVTYENLYGDREVQSFPPWGVSEW